MGKKMNNSRFKHPFIIATIISALSFQYACNIPNNIIYSEKNTYSVDVGKGKSGASIELNISEKDFSFSTKDNKSGSLSRKIGDIRSYKVYLLRSSNSGAYPVGGDPLKDSVSESVVNVGASPVHKIKLNNVQGSTYSAGTGEYYHVALRAFSGANATGSELIKKDNGNVTPWSGTTSSSPRIAVTSGNGIQVIHRTLQITSTTPLSLTINLDGSVGAQLDTNVTVNLGSSGSSTVSGAFSSNSRVFTLAGVSIQNGTHRTLAKLAQPEEMAFDSNGNLYIADRNSHRILKMDKTTETVSIVAGDGTASSTPKTGDGGKATDAKLKEPCGIAIDAQNNIYIVESIHNTVRKIDSASGIITTVAGIGTSDYSGDGGQATNAQLSSPEGVAVDSNGNLYIADSFNQRVRKVDPSGVITTIVGTSNSCSASPSGTIATQACVGQITSIALDTTNNLYMTDKLNHRVLKLNISDNKIYYVAGTGVAGTYADDGNPSIDDRVIATTAPLKYPSHVTFDAPNNRLFIADSGNHKFMVVTLSDGKIDRYVGPKTTAIADFPVGTGSILLSNTLANVRFSLEEGGVGTRFGGSTAIDSSGNVYIADRFNSVIKRVTVSDNKIRRYMDYLLANAGNLQPATKAQLFYPTAITRGRDNYIYFSDRNNHAIRRIDTNTGIIENFAGTVSNPCLVPTDACGDGLDYTDPSVQFNTPHDMIMDTIGNIYIADRVNQRIRKITKSTGKITTIAGNGTQCAVTTSACGDGGLATAAQLKFPSAVSLDKYGNIYIVDRDNNRVRKVDPVTNIITTVVGTGASGFSGDGGLATAATLNQPYEMVFDVNDNMYIADRTNKRIRRVDAATGIITTYAGTGATCTTALYPCGDGGQATNATFVEPVNIAMDSIGNLYILDKLNYRIRKVDTNTGIISTVLGTGSWGLTPDGYTALNSKLRDAYGFYIDPFDTVYIGDSVNGLVRYIK